jgi:hypothetical protein
MLQAMVTQAAPAANSIETELNLVDKRITSLRIEYERFFAGDLKLPPLETRRRLEEKLKSLGNGEIERAADRFRLQTIESRYNSLRELWEKRLKAREEGIRLRGRVEAAAAEAALNAAAASPVKPVKRVDMTPLFQRYVSAREALGEDVGKLKYERFEELVRKQAEEIRKKTGCKRLLFEVQTVDGRVRLVGRPAPARETNVR